jgi:Methyltransferase domain
MHRFWRSVIEPVLNAVEPRVIVEIGAYEGRNTAKILDYCRRNGAVAHVIDPMPEFSMEQWQKEWGEAIFDQRLSLDALPRVGAMDVALIDGDHNWYTVHTELKLIESSAEDAKSFPVVLLHDVDWPYGRRDSYYDPATIPQRYRHPSAKRGIRPGQSELVDRGGLNSHFEHALHEGSARNGVLTAVEDFVASSRTEFCVSIVPGIHGLAILATTWSVRRNPKLAGLLASFDSKEFLVRQCREIEEARVREILRGREKRKLLKRRVQELEKQVANNYEPGERPAQRRARV